MCRPPTPPLGPIALTVNTCPLKIHLLILLHLLNKACCIQLATNYTPSVLGLSSPPQKGPAQISAER